LAANNPYAPAIAAYFNAKSAAASSGLLSSASNPAAAASTTALTAADASQPTQSDRMVVEDASAVTAEGTAAALASQASPWSGPSLQHLNVLIRSVLGNQQAASSQVRRCVYVFWVMGLEGVFEQITHAPNFERRPSL
jgi:hypothetical protein